MKTPSSPFLRSLYEHMLASRYSKRTIESYLYWIRYFIRYNGKEHPSKLDGNHVELFLTYLAVERKVSASTQRLALNAIAFLYNKYLNQAIGDVGSFRRSRAQAKLPVVLSKTEVRDLLSHLTGQQLLFASLLYGSGLRRIEAVRLRVRDIDFSHQQLR